jgi:hypothetical protein
MGKKYKKKSYKNPVTILPDKVKPKKEGRRHLFIFSAIIAVLTAIAFFPMLKNEFVNWDDTFYVVQNKLLRGPDWKGIFTQPVVSNFHPVTILTLAFNYRISELEPFTYLLFNYLLHMANALLVFLFIYRISDGKKAIAFLTSLMFAIHPMHVESVAWVSERKDVLYTFFFLLSLMQYWRYLEKGRQLNLWISLLFFIISLLSKPAAVVLPLVLLLLDYWKGRRLTSKIFFEKIPFFLAALVIGIVTVMIQSRGAIAGFDLYPLWIRPFFGCYTLMIYFIRFFIPYPLSAFHPYPSPDDPGTAVLLSPLFVIALLVFLWLRRKDKTFVFGILFFVINLVLVLQFLSIGFTLVSERYTYVPYIGLAFFVSTWLYKKTTAANKIIFIAASVITLVFGFITFQRTKIWRNSAVLWTDVINRYPDAPLPRANRASYLSVIATEPANLNKRDSLFSLALQDCNHAIKVAPHEWAAFEKRGMLLLHLDRNQEALDDAGALLKLQPGNHLGYYIRGTVAMRQNNPAKALEEYNTCLSLKPENEFALNNRGTVLVNSYQRFQEALVDFNKAIAVNPKSGEYYLNRSICYFKMGEKELALKDAMTAVKWGKPLPAHYKELLNLK